jgi:hypothetical protein
MIAQVLFIQGGGQGVHDDWDDKLVQSLETELGPDYAVRYPRMPNEADPRYETWRAVLKEEFATLDDGAILVGHSIGATILINTLAEEPPHFKPEGVFLISAPFVGDGGWQSDEIARLADLGVKLAGDLPIYLYHGDADEIVPPQHARLYAKALPHAHLRCIAGRDHQLNNDMSDVAADIRTIER